MIVPSRAAADQRPRRGSVPVAGGTLREPGPVGSDGPRLPVPRRLVYSACFATMKVDSFRVRDLQSGYPLRARADLRAGTFAWCKLNPRPLHPDQEELITVPASTECVPPR